MVPASVSFGTRRGLETREQMATLLISALRAWCKLIGDTAFLDRSSQENVSRRGDASPESCKASENKPGEVRWKDSQGRRRASVDVMIPKWTWKLRVVW